MCRPPATVPAQVRKHVRHGDLVEWREQRRAALHAAELEMHAATKLQAWFRGHRTRRHAKRGDLVEWRRQQAEEARKRQEAERQAQAAEDARINAENAKWENQAVQKHKDKLLGNA